MTVLAAVGGVIQFFVCLFIPLVQSCYQLDFTTCNTAASIAIVDDDQEGGVVIIASER